MLGKVERKEIQEMSVRSSDKNGGEMADISDPGVVPC